MCGGAELTLPSTRYYSIGRLFKNRYHVAAGTSVALEPYIRIPRTISDVHLYGTDQLVPTRVLTEGCPPTPSVVRSQRLGAGRCHRVY